MIDLHKGDCRQVMDDLIAKGIVVDAIITDPPYGTTACKWDTVIPFDEMWQRLNKLIKPNGAIVLFGSEPFSSSLRMSNIKNYKYDLVWEKTRPSNSMMAYKRPLVTHENIMLFYKNQPTYNPQKWKIDERFVDRRNKHHQENYTHGIVGLKNKGRDRPIDDGMRFPMSIIPIKSTANAVHNTQKPVALMKYLIKTYSNKGDIILDFTMGSGTTGVAVEELNRDEELDLSFIGIENDDKYFDISENRIKDVYRNKGLL